MAGMHIQRHGHAAPGTAAVARYVVCAAREMVVVCERACFAAFQVNAVAGQGLGSEVAKGHDTAWFLTE